MILSIQNVMLKYNCEIYKIKELKSKDKFRYEIVGYKIYPDVTKEMALYLASKFGGKLTGLDSYSTPVHPKESDIVIGFTKKNSDINMALVKPVEYISINAKPHTIEPEIKCFELPKREYHFNKKIARFIELYQANLFADFNYEQCHIWGPSCLIPDQYEHIKSGVIRDGDYIFVVSHLSSVPDKWLSTDCPSIHYNIGKKIEYKWLIRYRGGHRYREFDEIIYAYLPFVIRKIIL